MTALSRVRAVLRGLVAVLLFAVFGVGALAITPLMLILRKPERCQPVVRFTWRILLGAFVLLRLIRLSHDEAIKSLQGRVIAANHPTLIDVVILTVLVPRTLYVAKHGLKANPFMAAIVRATSLPDDARLPEVAAPYLAQGWNVLVFPEGTRSPSEGGLQPLRRGAAQLALRASAPLVCVRIDVSCPVLGKRQRPWDVGSERVDFRLRAVDVPVPPVAEGSLHAAAVRLTESIRTHLAGPDPRQE